tara:strand:- start:698 stop:1141 length:444 start_codon:yes stop_codon:yes gene_type:complete
MKVVFREIDPFNCWIWIKFFEVPTQAEKNYLDGVFDSWYVLGRLGGFNSENLQSHEEGAELSWISYDNEHSNSVLPSLMHNLGEMEYQNLWSRCWIDFGTSDSVSIDILINVLNQVSNDYVKIDELVFGGENQDWLVEDHPDLIFKN